MSKDLDSLRYDVEQLSDQLARPRSKDEALEIAINAAETSMRALKLAQDPNERARLSTRARQLLAEAERIKTSRDWRRPNHGPQTSNTTAASVRSVTLKAPVSTRDLPKSEQILLLKAGYLNGFKFPPWTTPPAPDEFKLHDGESLYEDAAELSLSDFQEEVLDGWKRPSDALPPPSWFSDDRTNLGPSMTFSRKIDVVQDAATDCSVVASLCACLARADRGHAKLLPGIFHPYDHDNDRPQFSESGKYIVRLNFNGCCRKVVIDDRLPVSNTTRVIHVVDRHNPGLLWPALMEKAYLKVRGGYDFPGSNSGTDLWILTGWIPEQVFLQSDELDPDRFWQRLYEGFNNGDVLVTMGTGKMSSKTERELGLASEHDYAVLDLREVDGQRLLLIKNPWCEGTSWRGRFKGSQKSDTEPTPKQAEESLIEFDNDTGPVQCSRDLLNADEQLTPGTFWMDIENVIQHFESLYLNWNPGLFAHRQDIHFTWDLREPEAGYSTPRGTFTSLRAHPQYTVTTNTSGTMWILLWRHFRNSIPAAATDLEIAEGRHQIDLDGHISLAAFSANGRRVLLPEKHLQKGWFVDSPQTLLILEDCAANTSYTLVPLEQDLAPAEQTFTISTFSHSPVTLAEAALRYPYATTLTAAWTKETAGGNAHSPAYSTNPQFSITIPYKTKLSLLLEAKNDELNVHVKLVHGQGQRVHAIRNRDIISDSGDYRGCCVAETAEVEAGQYTIICSTFEPQQLGNFTLLVESSQPTQVVLLPREGAGRLRVELSAVGFKSGENKVAAPLVAKRLVKFYAIIRALDSALDPHQSLHARPSTRSLIRMSVEIGRGPQRRILIASNGGEYADSTGGVRTEDVDLSPELRRWGDMWLVLDRMYVGSEAQEERYSVELVVDQPDAVACGVWREWED